MTDDPDDLTAEEARLFARHPHMTPDLRRETLALLRYPKPVMRAWMRRIMLADPVEHDELMFALHRQMGITDDRIGRAPLN